MAAVESRVGLARQTAAVMRRDSGARLECRRMSLLATALFVAALCALASSPPALSAPPAASPPAAPQTGSGLVYDQEYPFIDYSGSPSRNDVARLQRRLASGRAKLEFREPRGYLDSLLEALRIDPSSQALVFSKTSLQVDKISPQTPRAIYFNDDTYVAWIAGSSLIEINTMDGMMGPVFYTLENRPSEPAHFERETTRCLNCHDTFSLGGGGVPNFLFLSAYTRRQNEIITNDVASATTDETPLPDRWGGWYITGKLGGLFNLGNILPSPTGRVPVSAVHPRDLASLDSLFDTHPYMTDKSDAVALLVLEHQVFAHNLIIHANYKSRMLMERDSPGSSTQGLTWKQLSPALQSRFEVLLEPLVRGFLFVDAARFTTPIRGNGGYRKWFEAQGPKDRLGRSLRDLDLDTRLFKHPLSFLIYSEGFEDLPPSAKEYVYRRLDQILTGRDRSPAFSGLSAGERLAIYQILRDTKPDFARIAGSNAAPLSNVRTSVSNVRTSVRTASRAMSDTMASR